MPIRPGFFRRLGIMDDGDEPVPIPSNIENHISVDIIGILEDLAYFREIVPANCLNDARPGFNFTRRIPILPHGLVQMPASNDIHFLIVLHNL